MKNFVHNFIYIIVPSFVLFICFSVFSFRSNAEALPVYGLDSSSLELLQGGSNQAINYYGMNDPSSYLLFGIGQQIFNDVDNYLYTNYGYDFQDMGWAMEDSWKDGSVSSALADNLAYNIGGFQSMGEAISNGFVVASTYGKSLLTGAKQYIMGKLSGSTITDVKDNIYTKVTDSYIDKLNSSASSLKNSDDILDLSSSKIMYSDNFQFTSNFDFRVYSFVLDRPFVLYSDGNEYNNGYYVNIIYPKTMDLSDHFVSGLGIGISGTSYTFNTIRANSVGEVILNGVTYNLATIFLNYGTESQVTSIVPVSTSLAEAQAFINSYNPYGSSDISKSYDVSDTVDLSTLLDSLKNTWVTSDDLRRIEEKIDDLTLGNIVIDGDSTPVIDTDNSALTDLQSLIQELLNKNADLSNYLNSLEDSDPIPDPDPEYNDQGISIPPDFDNDLFTNTFSVFKLPFNFFSIFEPIFYSFGYFAMMFGLFQFIPFALIVLVLIWVLK